jgi:hypothetical protein
MTYPNPRLHSRAAERLRARCVLAERFVSRQCVLDNGATDISAEGVLTISRGAQFVLGTGGFTVKNHCISPRQTGKATLFVAFSGVTEVASGNYLGFLGDHATVDLRILFSGGYLILGGNYTTIPFTDYADGERHIMMFSVDASSDEQIFYFDDNDPFVISGTVPTSGTNEHIITSPHIDSKIETVMVFNDILDADDMSILGDDDWNDFTRNDLHALWRCGDLGDDTTENCIRDKGLAKKIIKGDGSTSATFPTHESDNGSKFYALTSSQYISDFPELPEKYTLSVCVSDNTSDGRENTVVQEDSTRNIIDDLETAGSFSYDNLHNIFVSDRELTAIEKHHVSYIQKFDLWNRVANGAVAQLLNEGVCSLVSIFNGATDYLDLSSSSDRAGTPYNMTKNGYNVQFEYAASRLVYTHESKDADTRESTVILYGDISHDAAERVMLTKGSGFSFTLYDDLISFGGSGYQNSKVAEDVKMFSVAGVNGYKPRFFKNDLYLGEGDTSVSLGYSNTDDWVVGNNSSYNTNFGNAVINAVLVFNVALTDHEIAAVYHSIKRSLEWVSP